MLYTVYINESIPCRPLSDHPIFSDCELMAIETQQNQRS